MSERGRSLPWLALLLLAALAIGAALISAGVFDPPVNGVMVGERPLPSPTTLSPDRPFLTWLDEPLPTTNYTVRLTAVHKFGEPDVAYGLIIGDAVTVLVSPLGFVAVRVGETAVVPWQPWPHVHTGAEPNEIWLNVGGVEGHGGVSVRINRELLWAGEVGNMTSQVGLVGENYGEGETAVVQWVKLEVQE
ncbi:MAG: hypothetical protein KBE23_06875 [Chloroflexi bacterium]|nr:hypothetical protein [Chloroflexota bacterium]MBP7042449.1 hypothetical protein [Chloroflexota bacterium]